MEIESWWFDVSKPQFRQDPVWCTCTGTALLDWRQQADKMLKKDDLGGGFKYFLFSPLFGEDFQFDEHIFQMGGSTTNQ